MQELKFFEVEISANRNYAHLTSSNFFIEGFDDNEIYLLKRWFIEYLRLSRYTRNNIVMRTKSDRVWLVSEDYDLDIFTDPERLASRLEQLHNIETDFIAKAVEIKQPRF